MGRQEQSGPYQKAAEGGRFRGRAGQTRRAAIHYACPCGVLFTATVVCSIDANADGALADALQQGTLNRVICDACGSSHQVEVPVVYHDPSRELFLLVLPEWARYRELEERTELLQLLALDRMVAIPPYVLSSAVVYGPDGLSESLTQIHGSGGSVVRTVRSGVAVEEGPRFSAGESSLCLVERGRVRVCWKRPHRALEPLVTAPLGVRIMLHRMDLPNGGHFPLVVLAIVPPQATGTTTDGEDAFYAPLDIRVAAQRDVLKALQTEFRFDLELYEESGQLMARRELSAPLEENARFVLAASQEPQLAGGAERALPGSLTEAFERFLHPSHDRLGSRKHSFAVDSFQSLLSPAAVRLAVGVVGYWCEPQNEDYLICVQSFPLPWWRQLRSRVITAAMELGIALPRPLSEQALGEGHAGSRVELCERLLANFAEVSLRLKENDLDAVAEWENWRALMDEAKSLTLPVDMQLQELVRAAGRRAGREETGAAKGKLDVEDLSALTVSELEALLDDPHRRVAAALALGQRPEREAYLPALFRTLERISRSDALRLLGHMVRFGPPVEAFLIEELRSPKSFLRQACSLVLCLRKAVDATPALVELVMTEPSAIWKEVARALGTLGPEAIPALLEKLPSATTEQQDRLAVVLAHVACGGAEAQVEQLTAHQAPEVRFAALQALGGREAAERWTQEVFDVNAPLEETAVRKVTRGLHAQLAEAEPPARVVGPAETTSVSASESPEATKREPTSAQSSSASEDPQAPHDPQARQEAQAPHDPQRPGSGPKNDASDFLSVEDGDFAEGPRPEVVE